MASGSADHARLANARGSVEVASIRRDAAAREVSDAEADLRRAQKRAAGQDLLAVGVAAIESAVGKAARVVTEKPDPDAIEYPTLYLAVAPGVASFDVQSPSLVRKVRMIIGARVFHTGQPRMIER
ncbi:hypothetical protein [Georgenia sp. SUBG003]|uniref:hypothetical protein n=1 Tax=Georgenia sp. SUBG003 TaxID=1497974 RepID=UPI003AB8CE3E